MKDPILKIANGGSEKSSAVKNITVGWEDFLTRLHAPKIQPGERSYMVPGWCEGGVRKAENVTSTSIAMIDLDDKKGASGLKVVDLADAMDFSFPHLWAIYTTRSYDGVNACCRVAVPFDGDLPAGAHKEVVKRIVEMLPAEWQALVDGASYLPYQAMFLPCISEAGRPFEIYDGGIRAYPIEGIDAVDVVDDFGDLEAAVLSEPLDMTDVEVDDFLGKVDPCTLSYGLDEGIFGWANVIAALAHQYSGGEQGLEKALMWSSRNAGKHDENTTRAKYHSFIRGRGKGRAPITFASVIKYVNDFACSSEVQKDLLTNLLEEAEGIEDLPEYLVFKDKIKKTPLSQLHPDGRAMVAGALTKGFGKKNGLTKTEIKKALDPLKSAAKADQGKEETGFLPDWVKGWSYIEKTNEFYHIGTHYSVNRDAFNAMFDRKPECRIEEKHASVLALENWAIPTYADYMYWPGADEIFERDGRLYVNNYRKFDLQVRPPETDDEADVILAVEDHFKKLISNDEDRTTLLDWLTYVYNNPGKRVNWSVVLQGGQGTGKTFISRMMSALIGKNSSVLSGAVINSNYNNWASGSVMCTIEEVRMSGTNKYETLDKIKPYLTNKEITIEEKYKPVRVTPNFTNYLFLTNFKDAIPIDEDSRRYAIIYSDLQNKENLKTAIGEGISEQVYFDNLFSTIEDFPELVGFWLSTRKISESFNPSGRAPVTSSQDEALLISEGNMSVNITDLIEEHECKVINDGIIDTTHLLQLCKADGEDFPKHSSIKTVMLDRGYTPIGKVWIPKFRRRHTVWYKKDTFTIGEVMKIMSEFFTNEHF